MLSPNVDAFVIDDDNEEKFERLALTADQVLHVLDRAHRIKRNRSQRRASYLVVGRDFQGQCIAIPIEPTHDPRVWRPVTAWPCKPHEWSWLI